MAITDYHRAIFNFLETYRSEHPEAKLTYSLRKRNNKGRPRNLYLFTGNDNSYIFVGLYDPHNGNNKTRSIGFSCLYDSALDVIKWCGLEIAYNDPKLDGQQDIYQEIIRQIGSEQFKVIGTKKFQLHYPDPDWQENLQTYLDKHKPLIDKIIDQAGAADTFHISQEELEEDIKATNQAVSQEQNQGTLKWPANRQFWKYSPGSQAARWPDDMRDKAMAINFSNHNTGPLDQYSTQTDLDTYLGMVNGNSNETWNMMLFKDAAIGDVVFANRGLNTVVGIGIINGPYHYQDGVPVYQHSRDVNWLADQPWQYTNGQFSGNKNLFRPDTFSPTRVGPQIIQKYLKQYPQYRLVFEKHGLIEPNQLQEETLMKDQYPLNIILYGPPGTGKTYGTIDLAVDIAKRREPQKGPVGRTQPEHEANIKDFKALQKEGRIQFVTFHQNYTYEDFVMGLKPDTTGDSDQLRFEQREGVFYLISKQAKENFRASQQGGQTEDLSFEEVFDQLIQPLKDRKEVSFKTSRGVPFDLIGFTPTGKGIQLRVSTQSVHEISVGTLKRYFQGGIYNTNRPSYYEPLVEWLQAKSKVGLKAATPLENYVLIIDEINRANMSRVFGELITLLEDDKRLGRVNELTVTLPSGEPFSVPPNLYLIGTMNTADKSLALLDIALRRRFDFIYQKPDVSVLGEIEGKILDKLNKAIRGQNKSADFLIGHAYFIGKQPDKLPEVFNNRIIPLLMEYFNGNAKTVIGILNKAGVTATQDEITDQLTVSHVG